MIQSGGRPVAGSGNKGAISSGKSIQGKVNAGPNPAPEAKLSFSFEYYRQIKNFGTGSKDSGWFQTLHERLRDFSKIPAKSLEMDKDLRSSLRFHPINWEQRNCPIQRNQINWITDSPDVELYQITITTGTGRIAGFLARGVFYIVLFDPEHNLQPAKKHNYVVQKTRMALSEAELLRRAMSQCDRCHDSASKIGDIPDGKAIFVDFISQKSCDDLAHLVQLYPCAEIDDVIHEGVKAVKQVFAGSDSV